jgi:hypothetical protein
MPGSALGAGAAYFAIVFAAGFLLGVLRVTLVAPRIGDTGAVLIELPAIFAISWVACGWILSRFGVGQGWQPRATMGAVAFALLIVAELLLATAGFGRNLSEVLRSYASTHQILGLAGQIVFAVLPLVRR